ncbi:MAG TPA: hypothetical protein IAB50_09255 [Candidatus Faecivicinus avistercoris]|nr:hypothetical protein [Candidatus Faecivicinus avistercoris]
MTGYSLGNQHSTAQTILHFGGTPFPAASASFEGLDRRTDEFRASIGHSIMDIIATFAPNVQPRRVNLLLKSSRLKCGKKISAKREKQAGDFKSMSNLYRI